MFYFLLSKTRLLFLKEENNFSKVSIFENGNFFLLLSVDSICRAVLSADTPFLNMTVFFSFSLSSMGRWKEKFQFLVNAEKIFCIFLST
jgi:hypothetical protein